MSLLAWFWPVSTAPSFRTFCALAAGFLAQTGRRTVCGMLAGAGLSRAWRHQRAHRFFSAARCGRGWALELGIRCAAYCAGNPLLGEIGKYTISQVRTELDAMAGARPSATG